MPNMIPAPLRGNPLESHSKRDKVVFLASDPTTAAAITAHLAALAASGGQNYTFQTADCLVKAQRETSS